LIPGGWLENENDDFGCQTFCTITFSYVAFLKRVRVSYLRLGLWLVVVLWLVHTANTHKTRLSCLVLSAV